MAEDMKKFLEEQNEVNCCCQTLVALRQQPVGSALPAGGSAALALLDAWRVLPAVPCQPG